MTLHWDGNTPLFVTDSSGAIKEIKIEGLGYYAPAATNPMTFLDRDPAGFVVAAHWSGGHSDWQPSNPYHQICNTQTLSGYVFLEPGSDGISDGENTIQGVRNFDPALATWTSPDAYAGDASDPMSRKSYMWNRNNSYAYSDPTGYLSVGEAAQDVWKFVAGDDINTLHDPKASVGAKIVAGLSLGSNLIPDAKGLEIGGKGVILGIHALEKMEARKITKGMIEKTLQHGVRRLDSRYPGTVVHTLEGAGPEGRNLSVVVQQDSGVVKTAIDHSRPLPGSKARFTQAEP